MVRGGTTFRVSHQELGRGVAMIIVRDVVM